MGLKMIDQEDKLIMKKDIIHLQTEAIGLHYHVHRLSED
jgi:hypothetical protein